jgi:hypothetical protein
VFENNGARDGTRTRGLRRDRAEKTQGFQRQVILSRSISKRKRRKVFHITGHRITSRNSGGHVLRVVRTHSNQLDVRDFEV